MTTTIYILKLTQGKYYIGKSNNPTLRIHEHFNGSGNGSMWTAFYKPTEVIAIIPNSSIYDEDKYTLEYMDKYGIDNVRGGTFSNPTLSGDDIHMLNRLRWSAKDLCFYCGSNSHFAKNCPTKQSVAMEII